MKKMQCKELGGVCNEWIHGETAEEMSDNCRKHVEGLDETDNSHDDAMIEMMNMSPETFQAFMDAFHKKFEEAEEV